LSKNQAIPTGKPIFYQSNPYMTVIAAFTKRGEFPADETQGKITRLSKGGAPNEPVQVVHMHHLNHHGPCISKKNTSRNSEEETTKEWKGKGGLQGTTSQPNETTK
jgi:hypothetical protein